MSNLHILNLAAYTSPQVTESKRDEWVEYGEDNNYYSFLIDRYTNSPTNNAIINNISRLVYGKGLSAIDASRKPNEYAQMMSILPKDEVRKVVKDFKMLGNAALQVIYSKDHKKVIRVYHMPVNLLRAEKCNEEGDITGYYYSDNWSDVKKFAPKRIPAFGTSQEEIEILYIQPYSVGMKYYAHPDYLGALPYALLEEEIADYLVNEVQNSFSGTKVINFNSGVPTEEQQQIIQSKVKSMFTGATGQKVIVAFNNNETEKTTVDDIQLNDAAEQYQYLSEECMRKLMLAHNVTSPLLFGIATTTGFSSNADELKNSAILFDNMVIKPIQEILIDSFNKVLAFNNIALNLRFDELQPLDADGELTKTNEAEKVISAINSLSPLVANKVLESMTPNEIRSLVGLQAEQGGSDIQPVAMSSEASDLELDYMLNDLTGETIDEEWELVDKREYKDDNDSHEEWAQRTIIPKKNLVEKLASIIKSEPSRSSMLDKSVYKVRYTYEERYNKDNSRRFCKDMMSRTANGVVYRLEDIDKASRAGVNKEIGHKGQAYDLFKFKGGVNCSHYWAENLYRLKKKTDGKYVEDKSLSSSEEVESIPKSYKPRPTGNKESKIAPIDMPNNGHHPNYGK